MLANDHSKNRAVKGINFLTAFSHSEISTTDKSVEPMETLRIPIAYEVIAKTEKYYDQKTKNERRKSAITKNELLQQMMAKAISNQLMFKYLVVP